MYISILPFDAEISIQLCFFMGRVFFHLSSSLHLKDNVGIRGWVCPPYILGLMPAIGVFAYCR